MPSNSSLKHYRHYLSLKTQPFPCIYCQTLVLPKKYETHCIKQHDLNSKSCCVWCCGTESWEMGEKCRHVGHLIACFDEFSIQVFVPRPIDTSPSCPETESFFNRPSRIRHLLPPRAFQSVWPPEDLPTPPITFQNENLNLAASYLQLYLATRDTHDWMHLTVKAFAMKSFLHALDSDGGGTRVLKFWCWCDGGRDRFRQHRHMIVLSEGRLERNHRRIESALDLVNTLGSLSRRESECGGKKHFYISISLPKDFKLALATLWPGGVKELLNQEVFQSVSVPRVMEKPLFRYRRRWRQKIKDFYDLKRGLVIPVDRGFEPTTETTPHFIYLTNTRKLHFRWNPENYTLHRVAWLQKQSEGGNSFYEAVGEEIWTPCTTDQTRIDDMMPLVALVKELKRENEQLRCDLQLAEFRCAWLTAENV